YARTRVLSENILFDRARGVEPVVLRLSTVFGLSPRMRFDLVVNTLTVRAVVDGKIAIFGGSQWRPNVHCRDAARAFITVLEAPAALVAGEIFNVGGDTLNHTIADLGDMVAEIVGGVQVTMQQDVADLRDYRVSFEKIRKTLDFEPEMRVAAGIREVATGVLHAGFYYSANSLKAQLTRDGNTQLAAYCTERGLPLSRCGKLVVATSAEDLEGLEELQRRGVANGVRLEALSAAEIRRIEPRTRTHEWALFSPSTATVAPGVVVASLVADALRAGIVICTGVAYRKRG